MRSPSLFSPSKQQRYEKQNGSFQTFSTTNQVNKAQLADFRKEIRNNISQREPFIPQQEKKPILMTSWKKHERKNTSYKNVKLTIFTEKAMWPNIWQDLHQRKVYKEDQIWKKSCKYYFYLCSTQKKFIDKNQSQNTFYYQQQRKVDQLFKKEQNDSFSRQDNSISNLLKPKRSSQAILSRQSGRDQSPINLERFRSWDTKLDLQLKQLNNSKDISFYKYSQQPQKENIYETSKPLQTKDIFIIQTKELSIILTKMQTILINFQRIPLHLNSLKKYPQQIQLKCNHISHNYPLQKLQQFQEVIYKSYRIYNKLWQELSNSHLKLFEQYIQSFQITFIILIEQPYLIYIYIISEHNRHNYYQFSQINFYVYENLSTSFLSKQ